MNVTQTAPVRKPRPAPVRAVWLNEAPGCDEAILTIALTHRPTEKGRQVNDYYIRRIDHDFGTDAFEVEKFAIQGGEVYHVMLSADGDTCDCPGHTRWSHCKHLDTVRELVAAGRL